MVYHLSCPNCSTKLPVPDNALSDSARAVKCKTCAHVWDAILSDVDELQIDPIGMPNNPPSASTFLDIDNAQQNNDTYQDNIEQYNDDMVPNDATPQWDEQSYAPPMDNIDDQQQNINQQNSTLSGFDDNLFPINNNDVAADANNFNQNFGDTNSQYNAVNDEPFNNDMAQQHNDYAMMPQHPMADTPYIEPLLKGKKLFILWSVIALFLIAFASGWFVSGKSLITSYPHLRVFYEFFGVSYNVVGEGLKLSDIIVDKQQTADGITLSVKGKVYNTSPNIITLPIMRFSLRAGSGSDLKHWYKVLSNVDIPSSDYIEFNEDIADIPLGASAINILFVSPAEYEEDF